MTTMLIYRASTALLNTLARRESMSAQSGMRWYCPNSMQVARYGAYLVQRIEKCERRPSGNCRAERARELRLRSTSVGGCSGVGRQRPAPPGVALRTIDNVDTYSGIGGRYA
jgi:hypothetical protein